MWWPARRLTVFDTALGRIGMLICYDSEFPLLARALAEAGVEILLVPRRRPRRWPALPGCGSASMARALENQCVTVHAPMVGDAAWCAADRGRHRPRCRSTARPTAAVPRPASLSRATPTVPGWVIAEVSRAAIAAVRADGGVLNLATLARTAARLAKRRACR